MRISTRAAARGALLAAFFGALAAVAAACGSSSASTPSSPTPSTSPSVSVTAAIKADWEKFFAGTTPAAQKIPLLENGQQFAQTIRAQAQSPLAKSTVAKVSSVKVTSATTATVQYSILLGTQVALADQTGQAVLQDGAWKVSAQSFQALLALEGAASSSPSASP
jgi:hypothetical protein